MTWRSVIGERPVVFAHKIARRTRIRSIVSYSSTLAKTTGSSGRDCDTQPDCTPYTE